MAERTDAPRARCLCLDIETARQDQTALRELGVFRPDLDARLRIPGKARDLAARLDALTEDAAFVLGHNIVAFDQPALAQLYPMPGPASPAPGGYPRAVAGGLSAEPLSPPGEGLQAVHHHPQRPGAGCGAGLHALPGSERGPAGAGGGASGRSPVPALPALARAGQGRCESLCQPAPGAAPVPGRSGGGLAAGDRRQGVHLCAAHAIDRLAARPGVAQAPGLHPGLAAGCRWQFGAAALGGGKLSADPRGHLCPARPALHRSGLHLVPRAA
jgi:hypothetical protein